MLPSPAAPTVEASKTGGGGKGEGSKPCDVEPTATSPARAVEAGEAAVTPSAEEEPTPATPRRDAAGAHHLCVLCVWSLSGLVYIYELRIGAESYRLFSLFLPPCLTDLFSNTRCFFFFFLYTSYTTEHTSSSSSRIGGGRRGSTSRRIGGGRRGSSRIGGETGT